MKRLKAAWGDTWLGSELLKCLLLINEREESWYSWWTLIKLFIIFSAILLVVQPIFKSTKFMLLFFLNILSLGGSPPTHQHCL